MKDWERKEIEVERLAVDLDNFRIGEQDNPRAAYHAILEEQKESLSNLAADIIDHGLNPAELAIVYPDPEKEGQYVAVEGNRRLTALRLLDTPALATGTPWHTKFVELSKRYKAKGEPVKKIFCCVMKDKAAAMLWMDRKHLFLGGRGLAQWGAQATARADAFRGKVRPSKAVMDFLASNKKLPATLAKSLARKTTNIDRVFQTPYFRSALGANIEKDGQVTFASGDAKRGQDLLLRMLKAIAEPGFTVDQIRHDADRKDFIDGFAKYAVLGTSSGSGSGSSGGAAGKSGRSRSSKKAPLPIDRKTLALKGLKVNDARLGGLYREALELQPAKLTNTGGVLTRVFLELSTDLFLTKKKIPLTQAVIDKKKTAWTDIGISLESKVKRVLLELDPTGSARAFSEVRKGLQDRNALHSIESLHEFVHSLAPDPDPKEVKRIWGRWNPYFAALFDSLATP